MTLERMAEELLGIMEHMPRQAPQRAVHAYARGELFLLTYLVQNGGIARPAQMREAMSASTARIAAAVNTMEKKGLVRRETDSADHRKTLVHLTEKGHAFVAECRARLLGELRMLLEALGERDAHEYLRILTKIQSLWSGREHDNKTERIPL